MKRLGLGFVLAGAVAASSGQAAPNPPAIDRTTAQNAPVEDLARTALLAAAPRFVEVERPTFTGLSGPGAALRGLRFATAAESAGYPGLCKATTAWIDVGGDPSPIETRRVYKIVGDLKPLPDMWNDTYGAELSRRCAAAGRVIPTESADFGQSTFFKSSKGEEGDVWLASRALQIAIASAKAGSFVACTPPTAMDADTLREMAADDPEVIEDRENRDGCTQAGATLAGLPLSRLMQMEVAPCPNEGPRSYCLSAVFLRYAYYNRQVLWWVTLKYQTSAGFNDDVVTVSTVVLSPGFAIYD